MKKAAKMAVGFLGFIILMAVTALVAMYESLIYVLATPLRWLSNTKYSKEYIRQQSFVLTPTFFESAKYLADWARAA